MSERLEYLLALLNIEIGDVVEFDWCNIVLTGIVVKIIQNKARIKTRDRGNFRIPLTKLRKVKE